MKGRSITLKYKNFIYTDEISKILEDTQLNINDIKEINKIKDNLIKKELNRGYKYIIEDIFKLVVKNNFSSEELSNIYNIGIRTVQIWLKELGLNRRYPKGKHIELNSNVVKLDNERNVILPKILTDFLTYCETVKGRSVNTVSGYKIDLTIFLRYMMVHKNFNDQISDMELEEIDISKIDINFIRGINLMDIYSFLAFVEKERGNSATARARKVAAIKSFYKYLHTKAKVLTINPTLELESPQIRKRHPIYLNLEECKKLLASLKEDDANYERDYCILTLFLNCGLRLSELCSIEINKLREDTLTVIGKGSKERTIYLNDACLKALDKYLLVRNKKKIVDGHGKYLFLSSRGLRINKRTVELLVKKHITNAKLLDNNYTPHKLRHSAATLIYKYGNMDIRSLQKILGHENISTTQIYTHIDDENLREAVKSNPLATIKN